MPNRPSKKSGRRRQKHQWPKYEPLHVWSTGCFWHGRIEATGRTGKCGMGIPCCPHCGSVLYQCSQRKWEEGTKAYEQQGHVNYIAFMAWTEAQGKCWPTIDAAAQEFTATTGQPVIFAISKGEPQPGSADTQKQNCKDQTAT